MDKVKNLNADIVIIGSGCGGLSAALEAVKNGAAKFFVPECCRRSDGAFQYTGGSMSAACIKIQKEEGIEDRVDSYIYDIMKNSKRFWRSA